MTEPAWLSPPVHALAAARRNAGPAARLASIREMAAELDRIYVEHLSVARDGTGQGALNQPGAGLARWAAELIAEAGQLLREELLPELSGRGVTLLRVAQVDEWQRGWLHRYFMGRVYPLLTPLAVDPGRPFPHISSDSVNLLVELQRPEKGPARLRARRGEFFARVKIPNTTPRLFCVPAYQGHAAALDRGPCALISSADLVRYFVHHLFPGMPVRQVYLFRVLRADGRHEVDPNEMRRHRPHESGPVVRLDVEQRMPDPVLTWLMEHLQAPTHGILRHTSLLEWTCLPSLTTQLEVREGAKMAAA
jgi:polyphosphate kinase